MSPPIRPQIDPSAFNPNPDAQGSLVIASGVPFVTRWVPASVVYNLTQGNDRPRVHGQIHGGNSPNSGRISPTGWYQLVVQAREYTYDPAVVNPTLDELKILTKSQGLPSSILKLRLELSLGYSRTRTIDLDIGAGINTFLSARYVNSVQVLVPDITTIPTDLPEGMSRTQQVSTEINAWIHCEVASCTPLEPLYWTDTVYLSALESQSSISVPIVASAKELFVISETPFDAAASASYQNVMARPFAAQYALPLPAINVGTVETTSGRTQTTWTPIPGAANAFTFNNNGQQGAISIIQMLQT